MIPVLLSLYYGMIHRHYDSWGQPKRCPHLQGHFMMLPKKEEAAIIDPAVTAIQSGVFNHPVVVLSKQVHQGKVAVFIVSFFASSPRTFLMNPTRSQVSTTHRSRAVIRLPPDDECTSQYNQQFTQIPNLPLLLHMGKP